MKILVFNCGSSSIKYQLFNMVNSLEEVIAQGVLERVGCNSSELTHKPADKDKITINKRVGDHAEGVNLILETLVNKETGGVINNINEIAAFGHRVLHGGEIFKESVLVDDHVMEQLKTLVDLGPLHMPANLKGIEICLQLLPEKKNVAVFDTAFHGTMPDYAFLYALPYELYEKHQVRRYGFHGTSHKYVSYTVAEVLKKDISTLKIITCHLGNGSSLAAVKNGKVQDTTMGITPLEGLMMGTRTGDNGLGAMMYVMEKENLTINQANNLYNKKSGLLGVSGISGDMRDLRTAAKEGKSRAVLALKMFAYTVKKFVGSYAAAMGGVDVIVFTGGIGENDWMSRQDICSDLEFLGVDFDNEKNSIERGRIAEISKPNSKVKVLVIPTNEELVISRETLELV